MKYRYEDLSDRQFETLVLLLCQRLLGMGVQGFATGPDGGRDAKFMGTAEELPSRAAPWVGTVIAQAKHTSAYNAKFADTDFYSPKSQNTVLGKELPRITQLRSSGELDHYILFSNRSLAAGANERIRTYLVAGCGLRQESIELAGMEQIELWLKRYPDVVESAELDPVDSPLVVGSEELAEVVSALARAKESAIQLIENPPSPRVSLEDKNASNNVSELYAREQRKRFLPDTREIQSFLAAPDNSQALSLYESVALELQMKIVAKRKDYQAFDEVMEYLAEHLFGRDQVLRRNKRLTRSVLFYMYWHCDIGVTGDA